MDLFNLHELLFISPNALHINIINNPVSSHSWSRGQRGIFEGLEGLRGHDVYSYTYWILDSPCTNRFKIWFKGMFKYTKYIYIYMFNMVRLISEQLQLGVAAGCVSAAP